MPPRLAALLLALGTVSVRTELEIDDLCRQQLPQLRLGAVYFAAGERSLRKAARSAASVVAAHARGRSLIGRVDAFLYTDDGGARWARGDANASAAFGGRVESLGNVSSPTWRDGGFGGGGGAAAPAASAAPDAFEFVSFRAVGAEDVSARARDAARVGDGTEAARLPRR